MSTLVYPKAETVWQGAILHSIANAVMIAQDLGFVRYLRWDGQIYVVQGVDGAYGTIGFFDNLVGTFFDVHSKNNPSASDKPYDVERLISGMPEEHRRVLVLLLPYHILVYQEKRIPIITAAFWNRGEFLNAAVPWKDVCQNGGDIINGELMAWDVEKALNEFQDAYQMSTETREFVAHLVRKRSLGKSSLGHLADYERDWLLSHSESEASLKRALAALETIGL